MKYLKVFLWVQIVVIVSHIMDLLNYYKKMNTFFNFLRTFCNFHLRIVKRKKLILNFRWRCVASKYQHWKNKCMGHCKWANFGLTRILWSCILLTKDVNIFVNNFKNSNEQIKSTLNSWKYYFSRHKSLEHIFTTIRPFMYGL